MKDQHQTNRSSTPRSRTPHARSARPSKPARTTKGARQPLLEPLENRQMMSTVTLDSGILQITGQPADSSKLVVTRDGSKLTVKADNLTRSFKTNQVNQINVTGGAASDYISVGKNIKIAALIHAGEGNNTIQGGGGQDTILAGTGDDKIRARSRKATVTDLNSTGSVIVNPLDVKSTRTGPLRQSVDSSAGGLSAAQSPPAVQNLKIATQGRQVTVSADAQAGVVYQVQVQANGTDQRIAVAGGALPLTFTSPLPDDSFSLIVTPIANGVKGPEVAQAVNLAAPAPAPTPIATPLHVGTHANSNLNPVITLVDNSTFAGGAIHLDGLTSGLGGYSPEEVHYDWDFGDSGSKYNQLSGFNAAHVYDHAGLYTLTLTLTDPTGGVAQAQTTISVQQDNRRTIYVANDGNDNNSGLSADQPLKSLTKAQQLLGDNTRLLLKSGQSYTMTQVLSLPYSNVFVGAYGQGAKPRLNWAGSGDTMISTEKQSHDVVIQGLSFDTPWAKGNTNQGPPFAVKSAGTNVVVRDNEFLNVGYGVNANEAPTGLLIQDNTAPLDTGIRGYFAWVQGKDVTILGNTVANVTREHVVRLRFNPVGVNVSLNNFTNLDRRGLGDAQDDAKGTIVVQEAQYVYVGANHVAGGAIGFGPLGAHDAGIQGDSTDYVVAENNQVDQTNIQLFAGLHHATITGNVLRFDTTNVDSGVMTGISIGAWDSYFNRGVSDVSITYNTGITHSAQGQFMRLDGKASNLTLDYNLYVAPQLKTGAYGSAVLSIKGGLGSFSEIRGNIWPKAQTDGWANGGLLAIGGATGTGNGFESPAQWDANPNVEDEQFLNVTLNNGYQVSANGVTAGSRLAA